MTLLTCVLATLLPQAPPQVLDLRAPSVPLVVHDPYFSIWSPHDRPTDGWPTHWTGRQWPLSCVVTIDGEARRLLGPEPAAVPPLPWQRTEITATTTTFHFADARVGLQFQFVTPALPEDLDVLSRPLTYLRWTAVSADGASHRLEIAFDVPAVITVDRAEQATRAVVLVVDGLDIAGVGSQEQPVLQKAGDDLRIDWGHAYLAQARGAGSVGNAADGSLQLRAALTVPAGRSTWHDAMLAYDDLFAMRYFDRDLRALWRHKLGRDAGWLLRTAWQERDGLLGLCRRFDQDLTSTATALGGERYAQLCALAYRQCLGANKLCADQRGRPLLFPKENFSNGCVNTVDVIYPMAPLFLLLGADLAKAMLVPVLDYAASPRWRFPFAPHDLGTYPHATGQVYGGGERDETNQMPVEESANLLLLCAAVARREGSAAFARRYWPQLTAWAHYLEAKGFDPERQLCTDDFTGHLAHNVNLAAKAILALGAYAQLCALAGDGAAAARWRATAEAFAAKWVAAAGGDGGATRLAFDKAGTWSQKYNLVWDSVLDLRLFPAATMDNELAGYRARLNRYGLPLDSRATFTKIDWTLWSACLTGRRDDFDALVGPVWRWVHETPDRVPICDWYETVSARQVNMIARPVVGGFFVRFLQDEAVWKRWFRRGPRGADDWAKLPLATVTTLVPAAGEATITWRFTTTAPPDGWQAPTFDDGAWRTGEAGFGTTGTPGAIVRTTWDGDRIWLRRTFELAAMPGPETQLWLHHDEDVEVWINGVLAVQRSGYTRAYQRVPLPPAARKALQKGTNTFAVSCRQTGGGQYIDVGLVVAKLPE